MLTEHAHHPEHAPWAAAVTRAAPPAFTAGLSRLAPLWTALRWRAFYPGLGGLPLNRLGLDQFAELVAYTCASGYSGFDFSRLLHDSRQARVLRQTATRLPEPHPLLAEDLLRDPAWIIFDKVHHAVISPARTPVLLIPTRYGGPHLLVKTSRACHQSCSSRSRRPAWASPWPATVSWR